MCTTLRAHDSFDANNFNYWQKSQKLIVLYKTGCSWQYHKLYFNFTPILCISGLTVADNKQLLTSLHNNLKGFRLVHHRLDVVVYHYFCPLLYWTLYKKQLIVILIIINFIISCYHHCHHHLFNARVSVLSMCFHVKQGLNGSSHYLGVCEANVLRPKGRLPFLT